MPFRSQAQRRFFHWAASHGKKGITKETVKEWEEHTSKRKKLPERVKTKEAEVCLDGFFDELSKIGGLPVGLRDTLKGVGETLRGSRVQPIINKYHSGAMNSPLLQKLTIQHGPQHMDVISGYMRDVLQGAKKPPMAIDLPKKSVSRNALISHLHEGASEVAKEKVKTRNARLLLGGGLAATGAGIELIKEGVDDKAEIAAGVAAATPIAQGIGSKALAIKPTTGKKFTSVAELRQNLKPGDIMLTSSPGKGGRFKPLISAIGGDPYGYHVETVSDVPKSRKDPIEYIHSSPSAGGAGSNQKILNGGEDIIVRRFKDPKHVEPFLQNLREREASEYALNELFGTKARQSMYDKKQSIRAAGKSFLPAPIARLLRGGAPSPGMAVCSSLPGQASPVCFVPGVAGKDVLPHHVRRTSVLQDVGHFHAPRTVPQMAYERLLQAAPWAIRGLVGAGLGYGTYKAIKAMDDK